MTWEGLSPPYRTIVADPPWDMPDSGRTVVVPTGKRSFWSNQRGHITSVPYSTLATEDIAALPVGDLASPDAHLYLWTTNRFLEKSFDVVRAWGFRPGTVLTWCKPPIGLGFGGAFASTSEFVVTGRRGSLASTGRVDSTWFYASRIYANGHIIHSAKPPSLLDLVEHVSPGPYVELFCRQPRFGWDSWGWGYENAVEVPS